uniref:Minor capsid protein L2 n=1 Tax=Human papillomavirus TaxID=10566 RepID=A0A385PNK3_9PAPI|nr:MAG: L2 protein [Human papillomavirus]
MSKPRRKRASPTDLYNTCLQGGDCIPDVKNKFENNTIADWLLKIFGSIVYFGNLGIGTGRGSGGSFGYRPLGSAGAGTPTPDIPITRPNVVIEPLGPQPVIPLDSGASSIVPLSEGVPDIGYIAPDSGPGVGAQDIELYTITDPATDVGGVGGGPVVSTTEETETIFIDAHPAPAGPKQVFYDASINATLETQINPFLNTDINNTNIFVDPNLSGETVGGASFETIPLERLDFQEFEIETPPTESTPVGRRVLNRVRDLYSRFIEQVPIREQDFLIQPTRLVQFEYENPAFDPDVSFEFEHDIAQLEAAPREEFADIVYLSRPRLSATPHGTVRLSRLGTRAAITTRSGLTVGPQVHFYMDLSAIEAAEAIELTPLAEFSHESTVVDDLLADTVIDDPANAANVVYSEADLEDNFSEQFNNSHIILSMTDEESNTTQIPFLSASSIKLFVPDVGDGLFVSYPVDKFDNIDFILPNELPIEPSFILTDGYDFDLNPALWPRKRRRLDIF